MSYEDSSETKNKKFKNFTKLSAYEEIFPVVTKTLQFLHSFRRKSQDPCHIRLLDKTEEYAVGILNSLADGYNKYHAEDKVVLYSSSRSSLSNTQSMLLLLGSLGIIPVEAGRKIIDCYDEKMRIFNGLIKKLEDVA